MGATHVEATVRNPTDLTRAWTGRFLVATGATESVVLTAAMRGIGIEPRIERACELDDGRHQVFGEAGAELEFLGEIVAGMVVFGPDEAEPLLGCTALESAGFEVDPRNQTLKKLLAVALKTARHLRGHVSIGSPVGRFTHPSVGTQCLQGFSQFAVTVSPRRGSPRGGGRSGVGRGAGRRGPLGASR